MLLPSCSCCDHLSPATLTPRAGQTVQAVCVSLAQSFIMWLGASALLYKSQSPLGQHGNGREEPPPAQHSGLDMYKPTSSSYCFRDTCLMPMMGAVSVSQSYCLCQKTNALFKLFFFLFFFLWLHCVPGWGACSKCRIYWNTQMCICTIGKRALQLSKC